MFSIKPTKSSGPNGYSNGFYWDAWDIVAKDVTYTIKEFMKNGKLQGEINATIIVVITKIQNPIFASQYRPIS